MSVISPQLFQKHTDIFSHLFNHTSDIVILISVENKETFRYALANQKALTLFGWTESIYGRLLNEVLPEDKVETITGRYQEVINAKTSLTYKEPIRLKDGHVVGKAVLTPLFNDVNECTHILTIVQDITEQKVKEDELETSQNYVKSFLENSGDAISIWSLNGKVIDLNPSFEKLFGWKRDEVIGSMSINTNNFVPDNKKKEADYFRRQMQLGETINDYRTERKHKDGHLIDVSITYSPVKDGDGKVIAAMLSCRDITRNKRLEDQLKEAKERLELVWSHTADGIYMFTLEGRLLDVNPAFTSLFGWIKDDIKGSTPKIKFTPPHLEGEIQEIRNKLKQGESIVGLETQRRKKDGTFLDVMATYNPIKNELGEVWAAVGVYKNIKDQQQIKAKLIESQQRLSSLFENNLDAVYSTDTNGHFVEINPAVERITGYSKDDLIGRSFIPLILPNEIEHTIQRFEKALHGDSQEYESAIIHRKGHKIDLLVKNIPITVEGKIVGVYCIAKDITNEKRTKEELNHLKERLESFIEDSSDAIHIVDKEGNTLLANETFCETYGYTKDEIVGKKLLIIPESLDAETKLLYEKVWHGTRVSGVEVKRKRKNGTLVDISLTLSPIYNDREEVVAVSGIGRDISDTKQREKELREVKDELELIWNSTSDAIFLIGQDGAIFKTNRAFEEMLGWTGEELKDQPMPPILIKDHVFNQGARLGKFRRGVDVVNDEVQRITKDGIVLDILASYRSINKGNLLAVGMYKNITKQKQIQKRLLESEERYRMLVEHSPEAIVVHSEGIIKYVNKKALHLLEAEKEDEIIGKYMMIFVHPDSRELVLKRAQRIKKIGEPQGTVEHKVLTLKGKTIEAEVSSMPILYSGYNAIHTIVRDITDRKKLEQSLRESEERYRLIAENSYDMIKILNSNARITYASPSHKKVLGFEARELQGNTLFDFVHTDDMLKLKEKLTSAIENKTTCQAVFRHNLKDGNWIWVEAVGTPIINDKGECHQFTVASRDITKRKQVEEQLRELAYRDSLTGLYNRRMFTELIDNTIKSAERYDRSFAVMYLDMDKFKYINDTLGHDIGDELLIQFSERLIAATRQCDVIARMGGDEFTILLTEIDGLNGVVEIAERIHKMLQVPYEIQEHKFVTTSSIGIALYPDHGKKAKVLVRHADEALYKAKQARNSYNIYK